MAIKLISVCESDVSDGLIGNIFASVAEWESDVNGQRTRDAMTQKFNEGWWPGWAPIGYMNVRKNDKNIVVPNPVTGPLVVECFQSYATSNFSYLKLCRVMFKKGLTARNGKMLSDSSMQQLLSNTFYFGLMKWGKPNKMERKGNHKPLIDKGLFDQCQYIAAKHRAFTTRERKHNFLLKDVVYCSRHDKPLTAEWHDYKNKTYKKPKIAYYHCYQQGGCSGSYVEGPILEKRISNLFKKYQFSQEFIELVRQKVRAYFEDSRNNFKSQRQVIVNQKKSIEEQRNKLEDLLVDGVIDREIFKRQHLKLQEKVNVFNNQIIELENRQEIDIDLIDEVLALTRNIYKTYEEAPLHLKRHYLHFFFEAVYIKNKRIVKVSETPIFSALRRQNYIITKDNWLPG